MARRYHVEIDGKVVIDFSNFWLPPTTSWFSDLSAGRHTVRIIGQQDDQPVLFWRPSEDRTVLRSPVADAIDYVVFAGPTSDDVIASYRQVTGPAPLMPLWAYGYIHCRERFHSSQEILDTAAEFRKRNLPLDVIVQDWQYWGKYGWNAMKWDERYYPDPKGMIDRLHAMNVEFMVSVWSKIDPETRSWQAIRSERVLHTRNAMDRLLQSRGCIALLEEFQRAYVIARYRCLVAGRHRTGKR